MNKGTKMKKITAVVLSLFLGAGLFAAPASKSEAVKKHVQAFFSKNSQTYVEYTDEENYDLYFMGKNDCFFYPTLNYGSSYDHYVFDAAWGTKEFEELVLAESIDIRGANDKNGNSIMLITAKNHIVLKKAEGSYLHFVYKETL